MKIFARAATVAGLMVGMCAVAAPSAMAADLIFVWESGPGDAVVSQVKDSKNVLQNVNDKSVTTGDINTWARDLAHSPLTFEVEGAEQDQGEAKDAEQDQGEAKDAEQKQGKKS